MACCRQHVSLADGSDGSWFRVIISADQKILLQTPKSTSKSTPFVLRIPTYILYQEIWAGMTRGGSSGPRSLDTWGATTTSSTFEQHHGHSTRFHLLHQPTTTNHLNNYHTIQSYSYNRIWCSVIDHQSSVSTQVNNPVVRLYEHCNTYPFWY